MAEVIGNILKILLFILNEIYTDTHSQGSCGKDSSKKHWWNLDGKKYQIWDSVLVHRKQKLFLSVYVDDIKIAEKKQNLAPMWKKLMKNVDIEEPTSFLDHVYLGCTQRKCKPNERIIEQYNKMFESRVSTWATEKLPGLEKLRAKISAWSSDMERPARKCMERYCELANKKTEQLYKVSSPCLHDHQIKKKVQMKNKGELSEVCSRIVLTCLYLARIGRPDILWSVNKLAWSVTRWTQACDRRLARLISYIHHTSDYRQWCHLGNAAQLCRFGSFQDSDFAGDLEDSKWTSGGVLYICGSRIPISWICKKQTSVSHSSTESEIISLDTGLRMDGLLSLDLWDLVIEVLRTTQGIPKPNQVSTRETSVVQPSTPKIQQVLDQNVDLSNVDQVPSNAHLSEKESQLYIYEDNEAVIKMIIKRRSPTMRHVSRTHWVALDWLFDRIKLGRHFDKRQLHAWWVAQFVASFQHNEQHHIFP